MKKKPFFLLTLLFGFGLVACSSDDDSGNNPGQHIPEWKQTVQTGTWKISLYQDDNNDETHHYEGYVFTFGENNILTAVLGDQTISGSWSITLDDDWGDDDDGNNPDDIDFNIFFASPPNFEELSDDWEIISISSSKIELKDDLDDNDDDEDYLTFVKI